MFASIEAFDKLQLKKKDSFSFALSILLSKTVPKMYNFIPRLIFMSKSFLRRISFLRKGIRHESAQAGMACFRYWLFPSFLRIVCWSKRVNFQPRG